jgi:ParB-like partition proteins
MGNRSNKDNKVIGRGLDALLGDVSNSSSISEIDIDKIEPNPDQPRRHFDEESLQELAISIRSLGIVQPITVREVSCGHYLIISGERRWRASQLAQRLSIPAYIVKASDEEVVEMALIENIQREDLNAIEIALTYKKLLEHSEGTQEELAQKVGKTRSSVSNYLRLLRLPAEVQLGLTEKKIDMGHARAILSLTDPEQQLKLYQLTLSQQLSVRQVEALTNEMKKSTDGGQNGSNKKHILSSLVANNMDYSPLAKQLSHFFGTKVSLRCKNGGQGSITIPFRSEEQLLEICSILENGGNH